MKCDYGDYNCVCNDNYSCEGCPIKIDRDNHETWKRLKQSSFNFALHDSDGTGVALISYSPGSKKRSTAETSAVTN